MKLQYLELIGQYKGLSDQLFDLEHAPGNMLALIGLNGSGKSQFMELVAEIFAYLEREKRPDFRVRSTLGFHFRIAYTCKDAHPKMDRLYVVESLPGRALRASVGWNEKNLTDRLPLARQLVVDRHCDLMDVPLPRVVGYASGLNENLQRPFMRNAVQYFDVMVVRARRRQELSLPQVDERIAININQRYRQNYPELFGALTDLDSENPLNTEERDTPLPSTVFLDYDCTNLVVACLGLLDNEERNALWPEVPFRHPCQTTLNYDLRKAPVEEDSIRDIQQLVRALGGEALRPRAPRTSDQNLERYGLDYLHADIHIDFTDVNVVSRLKDTYQSPSNLFWKLYKLQLLGVKEWASDVKRNLRKDSFQGHVKKPLKGRLPLSVLDLKISDGRRIASIDDLSDGEAQLLHTLGAVRIFGDTETLFIFDEPETHLNPSWRTRYQLDFDRASCGLDSSQALISSHSPFLISSLSRDAVLHFQKINGTTVMTPPETETFGASFEVLIKKFFGLQSAISQTAIDEIRKHLADNTLNQTQKRSWVDRHVGESMERIYLLRRLEDQC